MNLKVTNKIFLLIMVSMINRTAYSQGDTISQGDTFKSAPIKFYDFSTSFKADIAGESQSYGDLGPDFTHPLSSGLSGPHASPQMSYFKKTDQYLQELESFSKGLSETGDIFNCPADELFDFSALENLFTNVSQHFCGIPDDLATSKAFDQLDSKNYCACINNKKTPDHIKTLNKFDKESELQKLRGALIGAKAAQAITRYISRADFLHKNYGLYVGDRGEYCSKDGLDKFYKEITTRPGCGYGKSFDGALVGAMEYNKENLYQVKSFGDHLKVNYSKLTRFSDVRDDVASYVDKPSFNEQYLQSSAPGSFQSIITGIEDILEDSSSMSLDAIPSAMIEELFFKSEVPEIQEMFFKDSQGRSFLTRLSELKTEDDKSRKLAVIDLMKEAIANTRDDKSSKDQVSNGDVKNAIRTLRNDHKNYYTKIASDCDRAFKNVINLCKENDSGVFKEVFLSETDADGYPEPNVFTMLLASTFQVEEEDQGTKENLLLYKYGKSLCMYLDENEKEVNNAVSNYISNNPNSSTNRTHGAEVQESLFNSNKDSQSISAGSVGDIDTSSGVESSSSTAKKTKDGDHSINDDTLETHPRYANDNFNDVFKAAQDKFKSKPSFDNYQQAQNETYRLNNSFSSIKKEEESIPKELITSEDAARNDLLEKEIARLREQMSGYDKNIKEALLKSDGEESDEVRRLQELINQANSTIEGLVKDKKELVSKYKTKSDTSEQIVSGSKAEAKNSEVSLPNSSNVKSLTSNSSNTSSFNPSSSSSSSGGTALQPNSNGSRGAVLDQGERNYAKSFLALSSGTSGPGSVLNVESFSDERINSALGLAIASGQSGIAVEVGGVKYLIRPVYDENGIIQLDGDSYQFEKVAFDNMDNSRIENSVQYHEAPLRKPASVDALPEGRKFHYDQLKGALNDN